MELPYDPAIPLLGIYLKKTKPLVWKGICIPMFIAAWFTIAGNKEATYIAIDIWMDKEDYTHTQTQTQTQEYYSAIKKNEILPSATTWMDLEGIMLSEIS